MNQELSFASIDTMSYSSESQSHQHSSAPTTTQSSPQRVEFDKSTASSAETLERHNFQEESPDLLHSGFYDSSTVKGHAQRLRQSVVLSESMVSVRADEKTGIAITNSPSFSALASILEKKQKKEVKPDVSPDLIQFDDVPQSQPTLPVAPQSQPVGEDIFKTPEAPQPRTFPTQQYKSMVHSIEPTKAQPQPRPPVMAPVTDSKKSDDASSSISDFHPPRSTNAKTHESQPGTEQSSDENDTIMPLPLPKKNEQTPIAMNYPQRSSSMPVIVAEKKKLEKRRSFMSFFKSKRSVSSSDVPQSQTSQHPTSKPSTKPSPLMNSPMSSSKSFQLPRTQQRTSQRSTSSTSLFAAFKRTKTMETVEQAQSGSVSLSSDDDDFDDEFNENFNNLKVDHKSGLDRPALKAPNVIIPPTMTPLIVANEEKRHSQISQGETLFPNKLSAMDVESIVSLERNRSQSRSNISRRQSQKSNRPMSLVEAIESNAREEGMYVELAIPRRSSMHSTTTSIQQSPRNLDGYFSSEADEEEEELFNVEEFSRTLEFGTSAQTFRTEKDDDNDVSDFMEFADFIDFGGDLDLDFDLQEQNPLSQPVLNAKPNEPLRLKSRTPIASPKFDFEHSPTLDQKTSPFMPPSAFVPSMSRPISMSFRGLMAPALSATYQSDASSLSSSQASGLNIAKLTRRVAFSSKITLYDVYAHDEYDRKPDIATCNQLTPQLAQRIRTELNEVKSEMEVHESSRCYTHFF